MDHDYAKCKLSILMRDINLYTADEFRREMARTISGATGQDVPDDCHTLKAERDAALTQLEQLKGIKPELPPFQPQGEGLLRYGIRWNGPTEPLTVPFDDGYWTPYHLALAQNADAFGDGYYDGYYDGFIDGAKHHEATDCKTDAAYLGDEAMRCSEIAEGQKSTRLGIIGRQELLAQNAELVAQVEVLKSCAQQLSFEIANDPSEPDFKSFAQLQDVMAATPSQCLRQIQADAGRDGFVACSDRLYSVFKWSVPEDWADEYASRVKAGE